GRAVAARRPRFRAARPSAYNLARPLRSTTGAGCLTDDLLRSSHRRDALRALQAPCTLVLPVPRDGRRGARVGVWCPSAPAAIPPEEWRARGPGSADTRASTRRRRGRLLRAPAQLPRGHRFSRSHQPLHHSLSLVHLAGARLGDRALLALHGGLRLAAAAG